MPSENVGPNDIAKGEDLPKRVEELRRSLAGVRIRLLNAEEPLAQKARSWNPEFTVPNFQVVETQQKTFAALARFAQRNDTDIVLRIVTWDEAFGLMSAGRTVGPDALPDVMQVGTTWTGYLASKAVIRSRPDWSKSRGNWRDVLTVPASALPYTNDVRLLFFWKRLPSASPESQSLTLNNSSWPVLLDSLARGSSGGSTIAFPTGITLNLLHDYMSLVWAGGDETPVREGLLGWHVAFSDKRALAVPLYITEHSKVHLGAGDVRTLVSFPESSHEEVTRTFVNGGYRATLEPASFIGRWADDFNARQHAGHAPERFWDYASAIVLPGSFKGGGELVVSSRTSDPQTAFALADYLATDPEYTQVLAESGFLPSGRPGYGIEALVASLIHDQRDNQPVRSFTEAVQKAIDQGHKYPDFDRWPLVFENRTVLEKLQSICRRMAEGNSSEVRLAAQDLDSTINSEIYWPVRSKDEFKRSWPLLALISLLLGGYAIRTYLKNSQSLRRLVTLLHLYRASRHESAKILGDNLNALVVRRNTGELTCDGMTESVSELADHYTNHLGKFMSHLGEDLVNEVQETTSGRTALRSVVDRAWNGANLHFRAVELMTPSQVSLAATGLDGWEVLRLPSMATVILQEWFFNSLRSIRRLGPGGSIAVEVKRGVLCVVSPGMLTDQAMAALTGPPSTGRLDPYAHGLVLMRDILYCAFGARMSATQETNSIMLRIPIPLGKQGAKAA